MMRSMLYVLPALLAVGVSNPEADHDSHCALQVGSETQAGIARHQTHKAHQSHKAHKVAREESEEKEGWSKEAKGKAKASQNHGPGASLTSKKGSAKSLGKWKHAGASGKWASQQGSHSHLHGKNASEDFVPEMINKFLEMPLPKMNPQISETRPLVFMHQHRAGGTTMRKLLYNTSMSQKMKPHILCSGGVSCRAFKNNVTDAAVYGGEFCWREMMTSLSGKVAPFCMAKLDPKKLKTLLVNYGCVNEPFRRLGQCGVQTHADATDKKARMQIWNSTLRNLAACVPVLVDKQDTYSAAVKHFPQFKQAFWQMKKEKMNTNSYPKDCEIPATHMAVIQELAAQETLLYEAAVLASERGLSWREAKARLDATDDFQLNVLAALRLVFWHWMQPAAYVLLLYGWSDDPYFRSRSDFQVVMAIAVLVREVLYFGCTVLALVRCPAFLLVDVIATWRSGARGEVSESTSSCRAASAEAVYRYESGNIAHAPKKDYGPLDFTGKLAGGLRLDIRRFIAALAPAITFGSRFLDGTNGQFGVMEMIMSTCISGLIFSTFSGQPLSILGATGPFLAYTLVVYDLAVAVDVEFMPFYFWTCMWCSLFTVLVAVFDLCALMKHVTMFSEDIFAGLISLIFIIDGARPIIENFTESRLTLTNSMFEALLFIWTFGLATYLSSFRRSPWTFRFVRNFAANFAVTIALVSGSALAAIYSNDTGLRMLQVDADFSPNLSLSDGSKRPWIINPAGMDRPFPAWGIAYAILPAIGFAVLGYLDQNLTSVIVNRPSNNLKKPAAYHLD
ncbi:Slc4a1, partial [Symbiodinium necroappetens]